MKFGDNFLGTINNAKTCRNAQLPLKIQKNFERRVDTREKNWQILCSYLKLLCTKSIDKQIEQNSKINLSFNLYILCVLVSMNNWI